MLGKSFLGMTAGILTIVGALNWGLVGLGYFLGKELNVVRLIVGMSPTAEAVVYIIVGLAGVLALIEALKK